MLDKYRSKIIFCATFLLGAGFWAFGALDDGHISLDELRSLGILLIVIACLGVVAARAVVSERIIERMRQDGYDSGYVDGCDVNRPRVVPLAGSDRGGTPLFRAAQELGQESDVGRGSDRVG